MIIKTLKSIAVLLALICAASPYANGSIFSLLLDDFDSGKTLNKVSGNSGVWSCNPQDTVQYCKLSFASTPRIGSDGYSLRLEYNVDTPNDYIPGVPKTATNGYFTQLRGKDMRDYKYLMINIKGDEEFGYTRNLTIQFKNKEQLGEYLLKGITNEWGRFVIPLEYFDGITSWRAMDELVLIFDQNVTKRQGAIYIENIMFSSINPTPKESFAIKVKSIKKNVPPVVIDGKLDEWRRAKAMKYNAQRDIISGDVKDPKNFSAESYFMWDKEYLYFATVVYDKEIICRKSGEDIKYDDSVELQIDTLKNGFYDEDNATFHIGFTPTSQTSDPLAWDWIHSKEPNESEVKFDSFVGRVNGKPGYQIEAAIAWEYIGIDPDKESFISVSPVVNSYDYSNGSYGSIAWSLMKEGNINSGYTVSLGKLVLKK
ncbi:MAG: hypothetical protein M0Q46_06425 [Endomicrobiales bacterium]|nr:hypothetical protein [Endomicrobiales bacterium]